MRFKALHAWNVTPKKAIQIQLDLTKRLPSRAGKITPKTIAGVDVSFKNNRCCAAVCVFTFPKLEPIEQRTTVLKAPFPYIPTLLTFREGPAVLCCFRKIRTVPDVVLFDGQGILHPRKMGLAAHIGVIVKLPTIGCAKNPLYGKFSQPPPSKGSYSRITDRGKTIGAVLRTRTGVRPIFVSVGYGVKLGEAVETVLRTCVKYRIPEPIRCAHSLSKYALLCASRKSALAALPE